MIDIEKGLKYCLDRWHKPKYVMGGGRTKNADGTTNLYTPTEDCSSFVYKYLIVTGALPKNTYPSSTEGLFALGRYGKVIKEIKRSEVKRGDIFVAGVPGKSAGAYGHTGVFLNSNKIIHCTPGPNRLYWTVMSHDKTVSDETYWFNVYIDKNSNPVRYYRLVGSESNNGGGNKKQSKKIILDKVVDISEWQDPAKINYDEFAKDIKGVILRSSYTYSKDKSLKIDKHFETHFKEFSKRGVPIGIYHFSRAINKKEAKEEANFVYNLIKEKKFQLPIFVDMESEEQIKTSMKDISTTIHYWCKELEAKGYYVGFYCNVDFFKNKIQDYIKNEFTFWLANYTNNASPNFSGDYDIWQYTNKGKIKGYSGDIDVNRVYKDYLSIIKQKGLNKAKVSSNSGTKEEDKKEDVKENDKDFKVTDDELLDFIAKKNNTSVDEIKKKGYKTEF